MSLQKTLKSCLSRSPEKKKLKVLFYKHDATLKLEKSFIIARQCLELGFFFVYSKPSGKQTPKKTVESHMHHPFCRVSFTLKRNETFSCKREI